MITHVSDQQQSSRGSDRRLGQRVPGRYGARISVSIALLNADVDKDIDHPPLTLYGYTHNLSDSGLAVIVPSISLDERACPQRHTLEITLDLPGEPVELQAETVHCSPLDDREQIQGYLLGAKFKRISEDALRKFSRFLVP
jgi:hypothetical protein